MLGHQDSSRAPSKNYPVSQCPARCIH